MGCDIHPYVEVKVNDKWEYNPLVIWDFRSYRVFGFLAGIRNYSAIEPLTKPQLELPKDCSNEVKNIFKNDCDDCHSLTILTLKQLLDVDYNKIIKDRRITIGNDGGCTDTSPEGGRPMPLKDFLGEQFMEDLEKLKQLNSNPENVRVIFAFDS